MDEQPVNAITQHGNPKEHPNPHEHDVIWQENGAPTLGPGRPVSEKNKYINFGGVIKMSNQYEPKFEDLDDFLDSLLRGREIVIEYHGKQYGIFYLEKVFMWHNLTMMKQENYIELRMKHWNTLLTVPS